MPFQSHCLAKSLVTPLSDHLAACLTDEYFNNILNRKLKNLDKENHVDTESRLHENHFDQPLLYRTYPTYAMRPEVMESYRLQVGEIPCCHFVSNICFYVSVVNLW